MKKVIAIFFLFLISTQLFVRLGIYISWKVNQDYIAKNECINRHNPKSCCQGKCQLNKRLASADETQQPNNGQSHKVKFVESELYIIDEVNINFEPHFLGTQHVAYKNMNNNYSFLFLKSIIHPPNMIA